MNVNLLLDSQSLYARCWYASKEDPDKAVELSLGLLRSIVDPWGDRVPDEWKPTHALWCWDSGRKTDKPGRLRPGVYYDTMDRVHDTVVAELGGCNAEVPGEEADDVVATAAVQSTARGELAVVASGDKDLHQLHGSKVKIFCLCEKGIISARHICRKWGIHHPDQLSVALALVGDQCDGIPGVAGIGEVRCKALFKKLSPTATLGETVDFMLNALDDEKAAEFVGSLEVTLLKTDLVGVGQPAPLLTL